LKRISRDLYRRLCPGTKRYCDAVAHANAAASKVQGLLQNINLKISPPLEGGEKGEGENLSHPHRTLPIKGEGIMVDHEEAWSFYLSLWVNIAELWM